MNDLLAQVLDSHSNLSRWNELKGIRVKAVIGGGIWKFKGNPDIINSELIDVDCHRQWIRYTPFGSSDRRSVFEPERNAIETLDGRVLEERNHPREAFAGHVPNTPWDDLHVVYFSGYAMWGYLTAPFHFVMPGVETEE